MSGVQILTTKSHEDSPGEEPSVLHVRLDKKGLNGWGLGLGWDGAWYVGKLAEPAKANMMREKAEEHNMKGNANGQEGPVL